MTGACPISAVIPFRYDTDTLPRTLDSLRGLDEILIFDNGPTAALEQICAPFANVRIVVGEFTGFGSTRNAAATEAKNDWIFAVDADEWPDAEMRAALENFRPADMQAIFAVVSKNVVLGCEIRHGEMRPDKLPRLYNRQHTAYNDQHVHEKLIAPESVPFLPGVLRHEPVRSVEQCLHKINAYSTYMQNNPKYLEPHRKKYRAFGAVVRALWRFFRSYIIKGGMLDGWRGLLCSVNAANASFYKYIKFVAVRTRNDQDAFISDTSTDAFRHL